MRPIFVRATVAAGTCIACLPALLLAQSRDTVTAADYARAARFLAPAVVPLVSGLSVRPTWLKEDRFWYRNQVAGGSEFVLVNPARRSRVRAFNAAALARALGAASDTTYDPLRLPFASFDYSADGRSVTFTVREKRWTCDTAGQACAPAPAAAPAAGRNESVSPNGRLAAFIRDDNLWVRELASGKETRLTTDGVKDFGYATDNAGWTKSDRPVLVWSPDSRKIATFQQDQRHVGEMYLVETKVGHPTLQAWKYPLPGDSVIPMIHRVIVDLDGPRVIRLQLPPDAHRSTVCDHVFCGGTWADVQWFPDGSKLAFVSTSRDHKNEVLRVADAATGAVRDVYEETSPTQFESGFDAVNWSVQPRSHEFIWFSERENWGRLYLYDLTTGRLKNRITTGDWPVLEVLKVNDTTRTIWFVGAGGVPANPYYRQLYRVRFDGSRLTLLTPEPADHSVTLAPDGRYFVDSYSTPDTPPVTVLRDDRGRTVTTLERADISRLLATGWTPPVPFTVKARDGKTDLYGLMFRPTGFDSTRHYPIVNNIYPGPQIGSVGSWSFSPVRGDTRALAELGFVVIQLDATGTPMRSKAFHDAYYGDMGDNGLADQVTAMQQLAARYPWIDLNRAGIYGHSGGGYATADAMFRYPDFFKVGISEAGNHDNRDYEDDWGERYQGLLVQNADGTTNYDNQANQLVAKNLKGHLLIAYGTTDDNVPPYNSLLVVNALIAANRDFDLLALPNRRHGFGGEPYMTRRRWDYFVRYLMGAQPPKEYDLGPATRVGRRGPP